MSYRSATILYIEDNPINIMLMRKSLNSMGYKMLEAVSSAQGIDLAIRQRPELILLDLRLPDIKSSQIVARLRKHPLMRHVAIIALASQVVNDPAAWCQANGFDDIFAKPMSRTTLWHLMQRWVVQADAEGSSADEAPTCQLEETRPALLGLEAAMTEPHLQDNTALGQSAMSANEETQPSPLRFYSHAAARLAFKTKPYPPQSGSQG